MSDIDSGVETRFIPAIRVAEPCDGSDDVFCAIRPGDAGSRTAPTAQTAPTAPGARRSAA